MSETQQLIIFTSFSYGMAISAIKIFIYTSEHLQKFCELHQTNAIVLASLFIILSLQLHDRIPWVSMIVVMYSKLSLTLLLLFSHLLTLKIEGLRLFLFLSSYHLSSLTCCHGFFRSLTFDRNVRYKDNYI